MSKETTATETATVTPVVELVEFVPEVKANEYDATVEALIAAPGTAAQITVALADKAKHATRFAKAANAKGLGARKRGEKLNEDGTVTLTFTLGNKRGSAKADESASVEDVAAGVEATETE